jgi:ABC-type phosphate/phosphonate transport system ATPase subunit
MEHNSTMLVAESGMGKSTFLSHMEHEIKKRNTVVWVLRINLNEHTRALENTEYEEECIHKCKVFFYGVLLIHLNRVVYIWYKKYSYKLWNRQEKWL